MFVDYIPRISSANKNIVYNRTYINFNLYCDEYMLYFRSIDEFLHTFAPLRYNEEEWRLEHSQFSILTCRNNARLESASTTAVVIVAISIYRIPHSSNPLFLLHRNRIIAERGRIYPIKGLHDSRDFVTGIHSTRRFVEWHLNKYRLVISITRNKNRKSTQFFNDPQSKQIYIHFDPKLISLNILFKEDTMRRWTF